MTWQGRMTWRLPKSTQTSRWKTVWESERQERGASEEGVCGEEQMQPIRNRVKAKAIEGYWEEEAEKERLIQLTMILVCGKKKRAWVPLHSQNVHVNKCVWALCVCVHSTTVFRTGVSHPHPFPVNRVMTVPACLLSVCVCARWCVNPLINYACVIEFKLSEWTAGWLVVRINHTSI